MSKMGTVKEVASVAKTDRGVTHPSNIPAQQRQLAEQASKHNRQMQSINKRIENQNK